MVNLSEYILEKLGEDNIFIPFDDVFVELESLGMIAILLELGQNITLDDKYSNMDTLCEPKEEIDDISNREILHLMMSPDETNLGDAAFIMTFDDDKFIILHKLEGTSYHRIICTQDIFDTWNKLFRGLLTSPWVITKSARNV